MEKSAPTAWRPLQGDPERMLRILWKVNQARRSCRRRQSTRPTVTRRSMGFDPRDVAML